LICSAKGGTGKSTVAANAAHALSKLGRKVGLFDADLTNPCIARLLDIKKSSIKLEETEDGLLKPVEAQGVKAFSMAFLIPDEGSFLWRGEDCRDLVRQMLKAVDWRGLDWLIVDTPPSGSDEMRALAEALADQNCEALVVTLPQQLSYAGAVRTFDMLSVYGITPLALVENLCDMFEAGSNEAELMAKRFEVQLVRVPFIPELSRRLCPDKFIELVKLLEPEAEVEV